MALFSKLDRPVFLKEECDSQAYIERLEELKKRAKGEVCEKIEKEIKIASIGQFGENNIAFELKNSGMPMYIIRDLHIEVNDLSAQIDFAVVTRKAAFIIECKNLIGDIEIDNSGNFIRTYEYNRKKYREGIYSPITQNVRHLDVLKLVKKENQKNLIMKFAVDKFFDNWYKSIVVLANPKTILNAKYAKKEIKDQVIRADQLVKYIKDTNASSKELASKDDDMLSMANKLLSLHTPNKTDYALKYEKFIESLENVQNTAIDNKASIIDIATESASEVLKVSASAPDKNIELLIGKLKAYRLNQSREEKIKPYFIFNDKQMDELIEKMPKSKELLIQVSGFGPAKVEKYGKDIISIINSHKFEE